MHKNSHIGIFDSGIGGLTVLKALRRELPEESFIYLADSANAPYGRLSPEKIIELSTKNTEFLIRKEVKLIVVACNTATGIAINHLRQSFHIPFVGMEPAVKPAAAASKSKKIGVLATSRTFEADHFNSTVNKFAGEVEVLVRVGEGLVELIEDGKADSKETEKLLIKYLNPMFEAGIDHLVLGCTHYPFLTPLIRKIMPENISLHDPAPAVARQTKRILEQHDGQAKKPKTLEDQFFSSGDRSVLDKVVRILNV